MTKKKSTDVELKRDTLADPAEAEAEKPRFTLEVQSGKHGLASAIKGAQDGQSNA